jgi:hypothetical protein
MTYPTSRIGIFWIYREKLISKSIVVSQAQCSSIGVADTCFSHIDVWERERIYLPKYPTLIDTEYQEFPRGRVLFDGKYATFKIYAAYTIIKNKHSRQIIIDAFSLQPEKCIWKTDAHYRVF